MHTQLNTSPRGIALIESFEGFSAMPYLCPAGKLTIGVGHVILKSEPYLRTATLTPLQARALLRADLCTVEVFLNAALPAGFSQFRFDALVSLVFNIGTGAFARSTLLKRVKAGDLTSAEAEFTKWVFSNGQRLRGLEIRRTCEAMMFRGCSDESIEDIRVRLQSVRHG
ncbi:MAG: lysozyme [Rhodocyclales bacterium]|nr:lysozyme [Rhodocyclales bacterium]